MKKSILIDAPIGVVWAFLTKKDKLGLWYHHTDKCLVEGESYSLYRLDDEGNKNILVTGRVLLMDEPHKLVTTFVIGPFAGKETTVTWSLEQEGSGTRLNMRHEGIEDAAGEAAEQMFSALDNGWDAHLATMQGVAQA